MTKTEMLTKINAVVEKRNDDRCEAIVQKCTEMHKNIDTIVAALPRLREIQPVVCALANNNLIPKDTLKCFFTEGIDHRTGFSSKDAKLFGRCGGGADGQSVFVNLDTGLFRVCGWFLEDKSDDMEVDDLVENLYDDHNVFTHIKRIAETIDSYIENVEKFVEGLK